MSKIDSVKTELEENNYFFHDSETNYLRVLDTPHVWGMPFGPDIMPQATERQAEFERAIVEIIQKARYRCDIASLNSPDPDWGKAILGAIDTCLTNAVKSKQPVQFRFLLGQTPTTPTGEPNNLIDFKAAIIRLVRVRSSEWAVKPEIWVGRFFELQAGVLQSLSKEVLPSIFVPDNDTKMTWNHAKIIAVDGSEALVGGHNLNMDLFRSYPPVHDVSVVVHGSAAYGSQLFLNEMWESDSTLLTKEALDISSEKWADEKIIDPLDDDAAQKYMIAQQNELISMHDSGNETGQDHVGPKLTPMPATDDIKAHDLRTIEDLNIEVIPERTIYNTYENFSDYTKASRMLSVGKYWTGLNKAKDFKKGSELMKKNLIMNAQHTIRMSQMDLISPWKKNWSAHVVCHWIMEALLKNTDLKVEIVVSPLDAGAGANGDQYSFGSGAIRTFQLIEYYMKHNIDDSDIPDPQDVRQHALDRLFIAPLFFTDQVPDDNLEEGETYKWPEQSESSKTFTIKNKPLSEAPPKKGVIGTPAKSALKGGGFDGPAVESAPGNHAKIMIIDDDLYVVGSDNLYPGNLSEFNYLVEGPAVQDLIQNYWEPLWLYSEPHKVCSCPPEESGVVSNTHTKTKLQAKVSTTSTNIAKSDEIIVTLVDGFGEPVPDTLVQFEVSAGMPTLITSTGRTNEKGQFSSKITDSGAETAKFRVKYDSSNQGIADKYVIYGSNVSVAS